MFLRLPQARKTTVRVTAPDCHSFSGADSSLSEVFWPFRGLPSGVQITRPQPPGMLDFCGVRFMRPRALWGHGVRRADRGNATAAATTAVVS